MEVDKVDEMDLGQHSKEKTSSPRVTFEAEDEVPVMLTH